MLLKENKLPDVDIMNEKDLCQELDGRMADLILSDMCEIWAQTDGFWKRSLSNPYHRMMNTSGVSFKDHAGSMVQLMCFNS